MMSLPSPLMLKGIPSLPLDVQGGIEGGLDGDPPRFASLAASPFCFAKRGGPPLWMVVPPAEAPASAGMTWVRSE